MQTHQRSRTLFRQSKVVNLVKRTSLVATFGLLCVVSVFGSSPTGANAQTQRTCTEPVVHYRASNESSTAFLYHNTSQTNAAHAGSSHTRAATCVSKIAVHADVLSKGVQDIRSELLSYRANRAWQALHKQQVSHSARKYLARKHIATTRRNVVRRSATNLYHANVSSVAVGGRNVFPYGQCTWWADQRYHQLHGVFVPWRINANAWQWTARATDFGWRISTVPRVGDIMVLQPGVQGAFSMGHVAVVEQVRSGGRIIASSMNWGANRGSVTDAQFHAGPGVNFLSQ